ncbi:MAG: sigma-70 family RNA polymerase sigma factor [Myxococcota bacterium]
MSAAPKLVAVPAPAPEATTEGDDALRELYETHASAVNQRLYWLTGNADLSRDLTQDTFLVALRRLDTVKDPDAMGSWLHGIAYNLLRDHRRSQQRRRGLWRRWRSRNESAELAEGDAGEPQLLRTLEGALRGLDADKRDAFVLRQVEGLSLEEAAALLDVSIKTVSYRALKAEEHVRAAFDSTS